MYKRMANSLTGRFGLRNQGRVIRRTQAGDHEKETAFIGDDGLTMLIWDVENHSSPVEVVSWICAVQRRKLYDTLLKNAVDSIYVHTDSFMGFAPSMPVGKIGDEIGDWQKVADGSSIDIRGPGIYMLDGKVVGRGLVDPVSAFAIGIDSYRAPIKTIEGFRKGGGYNEWRTLTREISAGYQGRFFDGSTSRPYRAGEVLNGEDN